MTKRRADANDAMVGRNIRLQRLARGLSQTALADGIGITFQQVQKYEKGTNRVGSGAAGAHRGGARRAGDDAAARRRGRRPRAPTPSPLALLAHAHPLRLVQAFALIDDKTMRRALLALTEGIAGM